MYLIINEDNFENEKSLDLKIRKTRSEKDLILLKLKVLNA